MVAALQMPRIHADGAGCLSGVDTAAKVPAADRGAGELGRGISSARLLL